MAQSGEILETQELLDTGVLPAQYFTPSAESAIAWTGARRLLLRVLQDAIDTYLRYRTASSTHGKRRFSEIELWFESTDDSWLYAFESICGHLSLDPGMIRHALQRQHLPHLPEPPRVLLKSMPEKSTLTAGPTHQAA